MSVPRFSFGSCLTLPVGFNTIYEGCCQRITCNVTNVHNQRLDVTNVFLSFAGVDWTVSIVSVNGSPGLTGLPFQVDSNDTFEMVFDVCGERTNGVLTANFQTTQHGLDTPQIFNFDTVVFPSGAVTPSTHNFGSVVQFSPSTPVSLTIPNNTSFGVDYSFENFGCPNEFSFSVVFPILIPANNSVTFDCIWTPIGPNEDLAGCFIRFCVLNADDSVCVCSKVALNGLSTPAPCECLCLEEIIIETVEDGTTLMNDINWNANDTSVFNQSSICSSKQLKYVFNHINIIDTGFKVWFNPWLFAFTCDFDSLYPSSVNAPPPQGWFLEVNTATMSIGGVYLMNLIGTGSNQFSQTNFNVYFGWTDATNFQIWFDFYHIEDIENWIANTSLLNNPKWRRNSVNAPNPSMGSSFQNLIGSVYNTNKKLCSLTYIRDPNTLVLDEPTECFVNHSLNYTSRFYNLGLYNGQSEFTGWSSPLPTFELTRSSGIVNNFSTIEKTNVTFRVKVDSSLYGDFNYCIFQLFDETGTDNTVDFLTNYDSSRAIIQTLGGTGVINNHIGRPSQITAIGGDDFEISAYVETTISTTGKYRMAAIVYAKDMTTVNTFISDQIIVTNIPDLPCESCVVDTISEFNQYFNSEISNCIRPTLKERIQHLTEISEGTFVDCLENWGAKDFAEYMNRITLNIYRKESGFPTANQTTFFNFGQHVSNRVAGFPFGWQNLDDMIVRDVAGNVTTEFLTRVRWENTAFDGSQVSTANNSTFMNRINVGALGSTYVSTLGITNDWSQSTIYFEYTYQFDLSLLLGAPYIINQVKSFEVRAIPNEPNIAPISSHIIGFEIQGKKLNLPYAIITNPFCPNDYEQIRVRYNSNINGNFIFFMEPYLGGNVNNIMESELNISPNGIPQLFNVVSMDPDFTGLDAFAELDISTLSNGRYIVCGYLSLL